MTVHQFGEVKAGTLGAIGVTSAVVSQENKHTLAYSQLAFSSLLLFKTAACACPRGLCSKHCQGPGFPKELKLQ